MVETHALFEWSSEVALALSMRLCSWIIQETDNEDLASVLLYKDEDES